MIGPMGVTKAAGLVGLLYIGCSVAAAGAHAAGTVECRVSQEFGVRWRP